MGSSQFNGVTLLKTITVYGSFRYVGLNPQWVDDVEESPWAAIQGFQSALEQYMDYTDTNHYVEYWMERLVEETPQLIKQSLIKYANFDIWTNNPDMIPIQMSRNPNVGGKTYDPGDHTFSGSTFTPVAALAHYIWGKGEDMHVNLNNVGLVFETKEISSVQNLIDSGKIGTTTVSQKFAYRTYDDSFSSAAYLGSITLKVDGTFTRTSSTKWSFDGKIKGFDDVYDANKFSNRDTIAQLSTDILDALGNLTGASSYTIHLDGSVSVHFDQNDLVSG